MKIGKIIKNYKLVEKISSCIWKVECLTRNEMFVMKIFYKGDERCCSNEIKFNKTIRDKIMFPKRSSMYCAIVMILYPETLHTFIKKLHAFDTDVTLEIANVCTNKLISSLQKLHLEDRVMHLDIKPDNIVLTECAENIILRNASYEIEFIDFEFSHTMHAGQSLQMGTTSYSAPEVLMCEKYNHESDIWSLGCCIYELYTDERLTDYSSACAVLDEIEKLIGPSKIKCEYNKYRIRRIKKRPRHLLKRLCRKWHKCDAKKIATILKPMLRYKKRTI